MRKAHARNRPYIRRWGAKLGPVRLNILLSKRLQTQAAPAPEYRMGLLHHHPEIALKIPRPDFRVAESALTVQSQLVATTQLERCQLEANQSSPCPYSSHKPGQKNGRTLESRRRAGRAFSSLPTPSKNSDASGEAIKALLLLL